jgi:hypothetical protein
LDSPLHLFASSRHLRLLASSPLRLILAHQISDQRLTFPKIRDDEVGPGLDKLLAFGFIDPLPLDLIAGNADSDAAGLGGVLDFNLAIAAGNKFAACQTIRLQNFFDDVFFRKNGAAILGAMNPILKITG